jgi:hypothetical protein
VSENIWHPYTEPPDDGRWVRLTFDADCKDDTLDCNGFYAKAVNAYAKNETQARFRLFVHPTHWRELTWGEK